jgi:uncharacterized membrane protein
MLHLFKFWSDIRNSLWFVPASLVLGAVVLALVAIEIDGAVDEEWLRHYPRLFGAGADGSRAMLAAIATSSITVAALVFSITIAALTQASVQYTPRILRTFIRDRGNQIVLGSLTGLFVYCLVILRTVRAEETGAGFVPGIAVLLAFFLAIGGIGLLIFFEELDRLADSEWREVGSAATGFVEIIDSDGLVDLACARDAVIEVTRRVGDFVIADTPLVRTKRGGKSIRTSCRARWARDTRSCNPR